MKFKEFEIKSALPSDAAAIAAIEKECFPEAWSENMVLSAMENGTFYIAAFLGDSLAGYAAAAVVVDEGQVANIAVRAPYRGKGLGKALTSALITECINNGCETITLEVRRTNTTAINLYKSLGFKEVGRRKDYYSSPKADALLFTLLKGDAANG